MLKSLVIELCQLNSKERLEYILGFLDKNLIKFSLNTYAYGTNVEIVKKSEMSTKEIVFFAHYDIYTETGGANDNTSSVAIMLSILQFLVTYDAPYTIRVIFNDKEEILGALLSRHYPIDKLKLIIENVGSYHYLKTCNKDSIAAIFILELSGIGDSIFVADRSGMIPCHAMLNKFCENIAREDEVPFLKIPIPASDMISVHMHGLPGTVLGAIPYREGIEYLSNIEKMGVIKEIYPYTWKKIHSRNDNHFTIQERALKLVYDFVINIIKKAERLTL